MTAAPAGPARASAFRASAFRASALLAPVAVSGAGEAANRLAQLCMVALAGWMLGVSALGVIGLAWSLTVIGQALTQGGPEMAGTRLLALAEGPMQHEGGAEHARIIAEVTRLKLGLAAAAAPLLLAVQVALGHDDGPALAQLAAQTGAMAAVGWGHAWALRGLRRFTEQGVLRMGQAVGTVALLWPLLLVWPSPLAVPLAEGVAALLAGAVARHRLRTLAGRPAPGHRRLGHRRPASLLIPALTMGVTGVLSTLAWLVPILAAARWAPIDQVSYLTGVLRLVLGATGVLQIVLQAAFPLLARAFATDPGYGRDATLALVVQAGAAMSAAVLVLAAVAEPLVPLLLGPGFGEAGPLLRALAPVIVPFALALPLSYALTARGEAAAVARIQAAVTAAAALACLVAFQLAPTAWSVLVLHPVIWGQAVATALVAWRYGVIGRPEAGWRALIRPATLGRLLRAHGSR